MNTAEIRRIVGRARAEYERREIAAAEEKTALNAVNAKITAANAAQKICQDVAAAVQRTAHEQIARIVTRCLATVFGPDAYTFLVHFEQKRGKTEARFALHRNGREFDPIAEAGGGVCDVAALGLRLAALVLQRPAVRRLLVLDEPLKHLSRDYAPRTRELLIKLAADLDLQIIMVTHTRELACGEVIEVG